MTTKLGKLLTYQLKSSHSKSYIRSFYISTCTRSMATKHGKVVTVHEGRRPINSYNPLNSHNPPLSQYLTGWWHTVRNYHRYICKCPQWRDHVKSHDKLNTLYFHLQKIYGHQTRQGAVLLWEAPTLKAISPIDDMTNVTSRDNLKNVHFSLLKSFHFRKTYSY